MTLVLSLISTSLRSDAATCLEQFLVFMRKREGRPARVGDLTPETVQTWMDEMATATWR